MKSAILIMCHKVDGQLNQLISTFNEEKFDIFIHIDKKVTDISQLPQDKHIKILTDRVSVAWATVDVALAFVKLLKFAHESGPYVHYTLISGQDLPIKNTDNLYDLLEANQDISFINISDDKSWISKTEINVKLKYPRFMMKRNLFSKTIKKIYQIIFGSFAKTSYRTNYFGSQWMSLSEAFVYYLFDNYLVETELIKEYKYSICVDETMIHTVFMNSEFKHKRKDFLTYVDWSEGNASPKVLKIEDLNNLKESDKYFARKFDQTVDSNIITKVLNHINN